MSAARELLARYLRQRQRARAKTTLFLETLTRGEAIALASGRRPRAASRRGRSGSRGGDVPLPPRYRHASRRHRPLSWSACGPQALACTRCRLHEGAPHGRLRRGLRERGSGRGRRGALARRRTGRAGRSWGRRASCSTGSWRARASRASRSSFATCSSAGRPGTGIRSRTRSRVRAVSGSADRADRAEGDPRARHVRRADAAGAKPTASASCAARFTGDHGVPLVATYHPAYLLRNPELAAHRPGRMSSFCARSSMERLDVRFGGARWRRGGVALQATPDQAASPYAPDAEIGGARRHAHRPATRCQGRRDRRRHDVLRRGASPDLPRDVAALRARRGRRSAHARRGAQATGELEPLGGKEYIGLWSTPCRRRRTSSTTRTSCARRRCCAASSKSSTQHRPRGVRGASARRASCSTKPSSGSSRSRSSTTARLHAHQGAALADDGAHRSASGGGKSITGVPSGFHDLDEMTAGFQPADLVIVAARPSMGKTAFVTNIAQHAAIEHQVPVAFFSLEMSKESLVQRMLCVRGAHRRAALRKGLLARRRLPAPRARRRAS